MSAAQPAGGATAAWRTWELWLAGGASVAALVYDPLAPAAAGKRVGLLLVGLTALLAGLWRPGARPLPRAVLWWCGLVGWLALAAMRSGSLGLQALGSWVGATALLLAAVQGPRHRVRAAARGVARVVGGAAALWAVGEYVAGARGLQLHGGQGNPNWLGLLLALTLPLVLEPRPDGRRLAGVAAAALSVLQLAGLYLSHSRVAWAAATVAALVMVSGRLRAPGWVRPAVAAALLLILELAVPLRSLGGPAPPPALAKEEPAGAAGGDKPLPIAWAGRLWIWQTSLAAAARELPLGAGLGGFASAYLDAQGERLAGLTPRAASRRFLNATTAHNDWLEVAVEGGPVALLLLLATWGSALASLGRGARREVRWRAGSAALVAGAICATGDSPLEQPAFLIVLVLVLAAAPLPRGGSGGGTVSLGGNWRVLMDSRQAVVGLRCLVLLGAAMLLAPAVSSWLGARLSSRAREAAPVERAALLARAARVDPCSGEIALERGLDALLLGEPAAALPELQRARGLLANIGTDVAIGNAELGLAHPEAAVAAYQRALRRHPGSFRAHANLAMAYGQLGALESARAHLAIARSLQPGHPKLAEMAQRLAELASPPPSPALP